MRRRIATARGALACALCAMACAAPVARTALAQGAARGSGAGDPFFVLTAAAGPPCPTPRGPRAAGAAAGRDPHRHAGRSATPDPYRHDADIATAIRRQLHDAPVVAGTSLWITVQRGFVYADGCVPASFDRLALQRQLVEIENVERVFVRVTSDPHVMLPYPVPGTPN